MKRPPLKPARCGGAAERCKLSQQSLWRNLGSSYILQNSSSCSISGSLVSIAMSDIVQNVPQCWRPNTSNMSWMTKMYSMRQLTNYIANKLQPHSINCSNQKSTLMKSSSSDTCLLWAVQAATATCWLPHLGFCKLSLSSELTGARQGSRTEGHCTPTNTVEHVSSVLADIDNRLTSATQRRRQ